MADNDAVLYLNAEDPAGFDKTGYNVNVSRTWLRIPGRMIVYQNDGCARRVCYGRPEDLFGACRQGVDAPYGHRIYL